MNLFYALNQILSVVICTTYLTAEIIEDHQIMEATIHENTLESQMPDNLQPQ